MSVLTAAVLMRTMNAVFTITSQQLVNTHQQLIIIINSVLVHVVMASSLITSIMLAAGVTLLKIGKLPHHLRNIIRCASGCVVECRICNREAAGSNLG